MRTIGVDIGTTTICAVAVDAKSGKLLEAKTLPNTAQIKTGREWERLQNPEKIKNLCQELLDAFTEQEEEIVSVGVTGQMHGILYLDQEGNPVTPLYTWQDARGNQIYRDNITYSRYLSERTGYTLAAGYGIVTHFYNQENQLIPKEAVVLCTIPDFVAMQLGKKKTPLLHPSMAAGIGAFRLEEKEFDLPALKKAGVLTAYLPHVPVQEKNICYHGSCYPVTRALGDNQASFLGSVGEESDLLVNVGTGSQISVYCEKMPDHAKSELRPYVEGTYLCVGSSLCGGYAYALLKSFFQEVLSLSGCKAKEDMYQRMNEAAERVYDSANLLRVATQFNGTRENPLASGQISGIRSGNFHPDYLVLGTLQGICDELFDFYREMPEGITDKKIVSASGNGIRMNPVLQKLVCDTFGLTLKIPQYAEEASYGCALYALYAVDYYKELGDVQKLVRYVG